MHGVDGPNPVVAFGITFQPVDIDDLGMMWIDNGGAPGELVSMWRAALRIWQILRADGYIVNLTKPSVNENVGLLERVPEAIDDHATIALNLHYTGRDPLRTGQRPLPRHAATGRSVPHQRDERRNHPLHRSARRRRVPARR